MNNNIFKVNVVDEIPAGIDPGNIFINMGNYSNVISDEDLKEQGNFLVRGPQEFVYSYLNRGVNRDIVWDVSGTYRIDTKKIFITPLHPGYRFVEPDATRFYLDSKYNNLYAPIENPRVNGYRVLEHFNEWDVIYQDTPTSPIVYVNADYMETVVEEFEYIYYEDLDMGSSAEEYAKSLSTSIIIVHSEEELHALNPTFLGLYVVKHADGTSTPYVYNPYILIQEDFFICNCNALY